MAVGQLAHELNAMTPSLASRIVAPTLFTENRRWKTTEATHGRRLLISQLRLGNFQFGRMKWQV